MKARPTTCCRTTIRSRVVTRAALLVAVLALTGATFASGATSAAGVPRANATHAPAATRAGDAPSYVPPVDGPIVDHFRPPPEPWAAGNRGIDYAPAPGTPVRAAADGVVTFAGQVGGTLHVVVRHADGVRTSYSFLQSIAVAVGDHVSQGQIVGTAGADLHFGARVGDRYIDPESLFAGGPAEVHLVPDDVAPSASDDRAALAAVAARPRRAILGASREVMPRSLPGEPGADDVGDALGILVAAWR